MRFRRDNICLRAGTTRVLSLLNRLQIVTMDTKKFKKALTGRKKLVKMFHVADARNMHEAAQAQIAQLVEQRTENPRVTGSIPVLGIPV